MEVSNVEIGQDLKTLGVTLDDALFNSDYCFLGRASGHSMQNAGIFDGDILIINRRVQVKNNDVVVALYNGLFVCKIADLKNNLLISASDDYPPIKITEHDEFALEGVITSSIRLHRPKSALG